MDTKELEKIPNQIQALKNGVKLLVIQMEEIHKKVEELSKPKVVFDQKTPGTSSPLLFPPRENHAYTQNEEDILKVSIDRFIARLAKNHQRTEEEIKGKIMKVVFPAPKFNPW